MDIRLYGVNLDTRNKPTDIPTQEINASASAVWVMSWYLQFMNPYDTVTTGNAAGGNSATYNDSGILYDGAIGEIEFATTAGTAGAAADTAVVNWGANALRDVSCTADGTTLAACTDDATNNLTAITANPADQCTETWILDSPGIRCVRIQS